MGRALGADRLDRRGTRPGDPTLVASPRRVALHAPQRDRPRSVATSTSEAFLRSALARDVVGGLGPDEWVAAMVPAVDEGPGAAGVDQEMRDQCGSTSSGEAVSTVKRLVTRYRPARTLVEQSAHAQLVVVGSRGCGGFAGLLLGSVSHALPHHAGCPVAIVRPAAPSHALTVAERASAPASTSALPTSACRGERCPRSTPERTVSDPDRFSFFLPRCFPVPRSARNLRGTRVGRAPALRLGIRCCRPRRLGPEWPPRYRRSAPACRSARRLGWPLRTVGSPASGAPLTG